jgi:hypothetical protein
MGILPINRINSIRRDLTCMDDSVPKTRLSTNNPHSNSEIPNFEISLEHSNLQDLENIEHNLDIEIPYAISNKEVNAFI